MKVIGLCRFSYLAYGGFQVDFENLEEKSAYLYAPERMKERFRTFETLTLPSLRAQTDPDFIFLVVTGETLPPEHLSRLEDMTADLPQVQIRTYPPRRHRPIMQQAINVAREDFDTPCLQFRLDDDDAVGIDFVERLRRETARLAEFAKDHELLGIDFNRGFIVRPGPDGLSGTEHFQPYVTSALAVRVAAGSKNTVMNFSHYKVNQVMPTITLTDEDMLLRSHGDYNDSRQGPGIKAPKMRLLEGDEADYIKARYGIDVEAVRRAWST